MTDKLLTSETDTGVTENSTALSAEIVWLPAHDWAAAKQTANKPKILTKTNIQTTTMNYLQDVRLSKTKSNFLPKRCLGLLNATNPMTPMSNYRKCSLVNVHFILPINVSGQHFESPGDQCFSHVHSSLIQVTSAAHTSPVLHTIVYSDPPCSHILSEHDLQLGR